MLICVLSLCCGGVAADVRYDFALLPLYGVRLVTYILCGASACPWLKLSVPEATSHPCGFASRFS